MDYWGWCLYWFNNWSKCNVLLDIYRGDIMVIGNIILIIFFGLCLGAMVLIHIKLGKLSIIIDDLVSTTKEKEILQQIPEPAIPFYMPRDKTFFTGFDSATKEKDVSVSWPLWEKALNIKVDNTGYYAQRRMNAALKDLATRALNEEKLINFLWVNNDDYPNMIIGNAASSLDILGTYLDYMEDGEEMTFVVKRQDMSQKEINEIPEQ